MSRLERNYTRLSELSGGAVEVGRKNNITTVVFDMRALPEWINQDEIGLHLPAIHRRCRLAGIDTLHVSLASGKQSEVTPTVVGRNEDSTALLGRLSRIKKVPTYSAELSDNEERKIPIGYRWGHVRVEMNFSEMEQRIRYREKPIRSSKEWSREINTALQEAIARKGIEHLVFNIKKVDIAEALWFGGLGAWVGSTGKIGPFFGILAEYAIMSTMYTFLSRMNFVREALNHPYRWSLFLGPQMDRAGILYVQKEMEQITGRQKLVRSLPPSES